MLTVNELKERLSRYDEVIILELLEITSEDILDRFSDLLEDKYDYLSEELKDD